MYKDWKLYDNTPDLTGFAKELNITPAVATILWHRGLQTVEAARIFLDPTQQPFYDPLIMKDMDKAVARIVAAINAGEKIVVYGDYDVDGMTSTSLVLHNLRALGADATFYIPDRMKEGYGFNRAALEKIADDGAGLLISVDCGISSVEDVAALKDRLDIVVTDHHLPGEKLPPAVAVVNPHRADCDYPDKNLAGVGVAYKLCQALWQELEGEEYTGDLELVALGTVADIVPLLGENRRIVSEGLKHMQDSSFVGIRELVKAAGIKEDETLNSGHVGFRLAPRLNAAGRLATARKGVELLLARDEDTAAELAMELDMLNSQRQTIEQEILAKAEAELATVDVAALPAIVVAGENWNSGVIGIVASRLVDKYYKPTIVMSIQDGGVCKGSCRSIEGLHMYDTLKKCAAHIEQFGGHSQAAGLTVELAKLAEFREAFKQAAADTLTPEDYIPKVTVDFELAPEEITFDLVEEISALEPFGAENPKPLFGARGIRGAGAMAIGAQRNHLRFQVGRQGAPINALFWNKADYAGIVNAEAIDMVYAPAINEWQGRRSLQCMVDSLSPADAERVFPERETLVVIYRYLYALQKQEGRIPYTATELALGFSQRNGHISLYSMSLGLRVFQELGLLQLDLAENNYFLPPATGHMELMNSPTYRQHH